MDLNEHGIGNPLNVPLPYRTQCTLNQNTKNKSYEMSSTGTVPMQGDIVKALSCPINQLFGGMDGIKTVMG
jgi:hypothetical protein